MLEVCVDSAAGAEVAVRGGADYIELCSSLPEGGLTPSAGLLQVARRMAENAKINAMIRCRAGSDFCYSPSEMDTMLADVDHLKRIGVDGLVFGALTEHHDIDRAACADFIAKAGTTPVTFHRAFDVCEDPLRSLEHIIDLGFCKILTSGQSQSAADPKGVDMITQLIEKANGRIIIMPGAGLTTDNVKCLVKTGASHFHSSCKEVVELPVVRTLAMGTGDRNLVYKTDEGKVKQLKNVLIDLFGSRANVVK